MKSIPDKSVDLILCDLPYGTTQNKWDSIIPLEPLWQQYKRICNGAIVLTAAQPFTSILVCSNLPMFKYDWTWKKSKPTGHLNAKKMPMRNKEDVLVFCDGNAPYLPQGLRECGDTVSRTNRGNYGACSKTTVQSHTGYPVQVIEFPTENGFHPTQKPVALMEYLIRTYTNEGDTVMDNTMGSGTTGIACLNTGRKFIGIEKYEGYFTKAQERIQKRWDEVNTPKSVEPQMELIIP
jgi:site-specific DNA-methyltransferase (adenine-specific)